MLFIVLPFATILLAIGRKERTITSFYVINKLTDVETSVAEIKLTFTVHFIFREITLISVSISPAVLTNAMFCSLDPFSVVKIILFDVFHGTWSMPEISHEIPKVDISVLVSLTSNSIAHVIWPVPLVLLNVLLFQASSTLFNSVLPLPFIHASVCFYLPAKSMVHSIFKCTLI